MMRSRTFWVLLLATCAHSDLPAQTNHEPIGPELATVLNFERDQRGPAPAGWGGGPAGSIFIDGTVVHGGKWSARIERASNVGRGFSTLTKALPMDFGGSQIEFRGFFRTEDVSGYAGLWMREDGEAEESLEFDNMQSRGIKGTTEWREYSIKLRLNPDARRLYFGFLLSGTGKGWVDDLQLLVDDRPIWEVPKVQRIETIFDRDHEFDAGSKIDLARPTPLQVENLALLAEVWGYLKYYHPAVAAGSLHWDYELFRIMPKVLAALDHDSANLALAEWIDGLGPLTPKAQTKLVGTDLHLRPDLSWIEDETRLGKPLSERLRAVQAAERPAGRQFYVSLTPGVGNPVFEHELGYIRIKFPDVGFQLLGLFRFWNTIRYWYPYRDVLGENWESVLTAFIPRFAGAIDQSAYENEMIRLIAQVHDTHANLWSSLSARPPFGDSQLPVIFRFIDGHLVVTDLIKSSELATVVLQRGDVVTAIETNLVAELVQRWRPQYAASNEPTRLRDMARAMGRGPAGPVKLQVERGGTHLTVDATRVPIASFPANAGTTHDLPGPTFQLLSKDVAYLKLSSVKTADARSYVEQAIGTKGWIIDARGYPPEFMVFALGGHLVRQPTEFARFTAAFGDLSNPGAFAFGKPLSLQPVSPYYPGKIVILVDEVTQSSAEYTTMAFRAAPGAVVVGSTTAGADGNVSRIPLPGGLSTMISGIGVFYPDKRPTQQVGIIPDVEAKPTVAGIRDGRDEVLEVGLRQILGAKMPQDEIEQLARARP